MNYIMVPRELIYDVELGNKRVALFCYLYSRKSLDDRIAFSIEDICKWLEMKPNARKDKSNNQILKMLNDFSLKGYVSDEFDFCNIPLSDTDTYHFAMAGSNLTIKDNFAIIYIDELTKILNYRKMFNDDDTQRTNIWSLLLVLSYIRANMNMDKSKPLCCYRLYETISDDIGINVKYLAKIFCLLEKMDIISQYTIKRKKYKNENGAECFKTATKIFADIRKFIPGTDEIDMSYNAQKQFEWQIQIFNEEK